jgi:hypothetical protein
LAWFDDVNAVPRALWNYQTIARLHFDIFLVAVKENDIDSAGNKVENLITIRMYLATMW